MICFGAAGANAIYVALNPGELAQLLPPALFVVFGLAFLRASDVTFDKVSRTCFLRRLDGFRIIRRQLAFREITDVRVDVCPGEDNADLRSISCLSLVTASAVPLTTSYEPTVERYAAMRDDVLDTLFAKGDRPLPVDPVRALAKMGRLNDAVRILRLRDGLGLAASRTRIEEIRDASDS